MVLNTRGWGLYILDFDGRSDRRALTVYAPWISQQATVMIITIILLDNGLGLRLSPDAASVSRTWVHIYDFQIITYLQAHSRY